jgi:DNA primase
MNQIDFDDIIQQILERIDIVDVVSRYVNLKRSGKNYLGLCPFHTEKTPSFSVSPEKQIFKCFGCGKGGNAIHFIKEYEGIQFREAVEMLAKEAGVDLSAWKSSSQSKNRDEKTLLLQVNQFAAQFYASRLKKSSNPALKYLKDRNIKPTIIEQFQLGYAPDEWDALATHLRKKGISLKHAEKIGLVSLSSRQNYIDKFRNRLMFPIFNLNQSVVGFGGRVLDKNDQTAKYINSPESLIYHKSKILFGLSHSKEAIRKEGYAIFVEGYFDFLRLYQEGIQNVVATSGTAFTEDHARLMKRFTDKVYLCYDADKAGLNAILKAILLIANYNFEVHAVLLPEGEDPDSFVQNQGQEAFLRLLQSSLSIPEFFSHYLKSTFELHTISGMQKAREFAIESISRIQNEIVANQLIEETSFVLNISPSALDKNIRHIRKRFSRSRQNKKNTSTTTASSPISVPVEEREIIVLLLQNIPEVTGYILSNITYDDFHNSVTRDLFVKICEAFDDTGQIQPSFILSSFEKTEFLEEITARLLDSFSNPLQYAKDVIRKLTLKHLQEELEIISLNFKKNKSLDDVDPEIWNRYNEIVQKIREIQRER